MEAVAEIATLELLFSLFFSPRQQHIEANATVERSKQETRRWKESRFFSFYISSPAFLPILPFSPFTSPLFFLHFEFSLFFIFRHFATMDLVESKNKEKKNNFCLDREQTRLLPKRVRRGLRFFFFCLRGGGKGEERKTTGTNP